MFSTALQGIQGRRLLVFCVGALLALLVAVPAAHASYNRDWGIVSCGKGKLPHLVVRAKGNPVTVNAHNGDGKPVIRAEYKTYSNPITRVFFPQGRFAGRYMEWVVFVRSGTSEYVSRKGTYGYCS